MGVVIVVVRVVIVPACERVDECHVVCCFIVSSVGRKCCCGRSQSSVGGGGGTAGRAVEVTRGWAAVVVVEWGG